MTLHSEDEVLFPRRVSQIGVSRDVCLLGTEHIPAPAGHQWAASAVQPTGLRSALSWLALGEVLGCRSELHTEKIQTVAERQRETESQRERERWRDKLRQRHREASLPFLETAQFSHVVLPRTHGVPMLEMLGCASSPIFHSFPRQLWVAWWRRCFSSPVLSPHSLETSPIGGQDALDGG